MEKKDTWALYIGHLIISMNEIDWMTHMIRERILGKKLSKRWTKAPLQERLAKIVAHLTAGDHEHDRLKMLLGEAISLCAKRNLAAHGSFALDARQPSGMSAPPFLLHSLSMEKPATLTEVKTATVQCIKLSGDISECIAVIEMRNSRVKAPDPPTPDH